MGIPDSGESIVTLGTRASKLALSQTRWIRDLILVEHPQLRIEIKPIYTSADLDQQKSLRTGSQTGLFVKEIEDALLAGEIDFAVHSLKDLPIRQPDSLEIRAIPLRAEPGDALITRDEIASLEALPAGSVVGTGSLRRQAQILSARPDIQVRDIRGNVDTRLEKLSRGDFDAVILACAGLIRLGMEDRIGIRLGMDQMLPAPGQGALAVEIRRGDDRIAAIVDTIDHPQTGLAVGAERAFLSHLGGGCNTPMGAFAKIEEERLVLEGLIATASGSAVVRDRLSGPVDAAANTARSLAEQLIDRGGESILNSWG